MTNQQATVAALLSLLGGGVVPGAVKAPARKSRKAKGQPRVKLTDEQKAVNAAKNGEEAVKLFEAAGYKNCVARETIKTYGNLEKGTGWLADGRRVKKGERALKTSRGVALFHIDQTSAMEATN